MVSRSLLGVALLTIGLGVVGCGTKNTEVSTTAPPSGASGPSDAPSPLSPAATASSAPTSATAPVAATAATATTSTAPAAAPGGGIADTTAKLVAAQWAMREDEIKHDPDGQWATGATASSTYNDAKAKERFSAQQATGAPDVETYSDDARAWAPKTADGGIEWLDLTYDKPVHASEVRVRESDGSGAVVKVEIYDETGVAHLAWTGNDPTTGLNYLVIKFTPTEYKVSRVKVTLATNVIPGWNEVDAVQLVGKP
jgi:hypothetical protein